MNKKVLIVEDQFVEANDLQLMLGKAGYEVCGIARSVPIAREMIKKDKPDLVLLDIFLKGDLTGIDLARELNKDDIAFIYLSANSNEEVLSAAKTTEPYGFIVKPFRERDLLVTLEIAHYRHEHSVDSYFRKGAILKESLPVIVNVTSNREEKLLNVARTLQTYIPFDYFTVGLDNTSEGLNQGLSFLRIGYDDYQKIGVSELQTITRLSIKELAAFANTTSDHGEVTMLNEKSFEQVCSQPSLHKVFSNTFQMKSCLSMKLRVSSRDGFPICFYSRIPNIYSTTHKALLEYIQKSMTICMEKVFDDDKIVSDVRKDMQVSENGNRIAAGGECFGEIVGRSHLLLQVFDLVAQVAPTDTSVLILGESGTGKERIADCIHNLSPRKDKPFVKINCAALPATLIESELFGHEKGAFTGASDKRIGKFEKADKGTIFLDEIGEMPLDLQVKLLRVLQEKYIERIGAKDLTRVDVRIIAATNRNLEKEVAEGRFRLDLYYRLNVFPVELPPLRERTEDIPDLASYFIQNYNRKTGKRITGLSDKVLKNMRAYAWPGNIRELENVIERSVLLAKGTIIEEITLSSSQPQRPSIVTNDSRVKTIHENERDYIIGILKKCNGKIWGNGGAAEVLNVPPSTLKSKMKKLGIGRENFD